MTTKTNKSGEFIYITKNLVNNQIAGSKLVMKTHIIESDTTITNLYDSDKLENRVILSNKLQTGTNKKSASLLTQQNLHNNIKFDFRDVSDNYISSRIVFLKYSYVAATENNNKYLFNNLTNVSINNTTKNISQNLATITPNDISNTQNYVQTLNFYTQKHKNKHERLDYYNFKLQDFLYKHSNSQKFTDDLLDSSTNQYEGDICFNDLIYELNFNSDIDLSFTNIDPESINKNDDAFKTIYYRASDLSYNKLESSFNSIDDDLYLFNKKDVISTFTFDLKDNTNSMTQIDYNSSDSSNNIEFFLINKFDFTDFKDPSFGKISLADKLITMNCRVLNYDNNFFVNNFSGNNDKIFLSLGNGICGLTQKNISENVKLYIANANDNLENDRIFFTKNSNINYGNVTNNYSEYLSVNNNKYLFDEEFKIDYTNLFVIRNTSLLPNKTFDFIISDIVSLVPLNFFTYIETFNNMELVNNRPTNYLNDVSFGSFAFFNYLTRHLRIKHSVPSEPLVINSNQNNILNYDDTIKYDFNGNSEGGGFFSNYMIDIIYDNSSAAFIDGVDFSDSLINFFGKDSDSLFFMNFYKITVQNFLDNEAEANPIGSIDLFRDFTGCIFIYYDPNSANTIPKYKYPNNNIEISFNESLATDATAGKIILNEKNSLNSRTNTVYIPTRNGSNYSRKQILGLIGLGNEATGRLLGIEPYDEDFIIGRGFINQFQINDDCLREEDLINKKIESQKHESNKKITQFSQRQNFADLVRNPRRSRISNLSNQCTTINNNPTSISQVTTPFTFFKTNRGNYLRSGR